jgi:hypothetical protein
MVEAVLAMRLFPSLQPLDIRNPKIAARLRTHWGIPSGEVAFRRTGHRFNGGGFQDDDTPSGFGPTKRLLTASTLLERVRSCSIDLRTGPSPERPVR